MAFTMPASLNSSWHTPTWHPPALLLCALLWLSPALQAEGFHIGEMKVRLQDQLYLLDANIYFDFTGDAAAALVNGVPLTIQITIHIERPRRWWWNNRLVTLEQRLSLQYHALSEQYLVQNLNSGARYAFHSPQAAMHALGWMRDFPLLDAQLLEQGEEHLLRMQAQLDIESLPSPLRPIAYISASWRRNKSGWYQWSFTP